jgi:HSP20 family molecular chaperone IbpA
MSDEYRRRSIFDIMGEYIDEFEALADEFMEAAFPEGPSWDCDTFCLHALCNLFITPQEVIITTDLPNINPKTVKIEVLDENLFEITAKMKKKVQFSDLGIYHRQGEFSSLRCQGRIPVSIDASKMTISFKGRIWEIRFPRKKRDH